MKLGFISFDYCEGQNERASQRVTFESREEKSFQRKSKLLPSVVKAGLHGGYQFSPFCSSTRG